MTNEQCTVDSFASLYRFYLVPFPPLRSLSLFGAGRAFGVCAGLITVRPPPSQAEVRADTMAMAMVAQAFGLFHLAFLKLNLV